MADELGPVCDPADRDVVGRTLDELAAEADVFLAAGECRPTRSPLRPLAYRRIGRGVAETADILSRHPGSGDY